jgi:hypothetical protein
VLAVFELALSVAQAQVDPDPKAKLGIYYQEVQLFINNCECHLNEVDNTLTRQNCVPVVDSWFEWKEFRKPPVVANEPYRTNFTDSFRFDGDSEMGEGDEEALAKKFIASAHPDYAPIRDDLRDASTSRKESYIDLEGKKRWRHVLRDASGAIVAITKDANAGVTPPLDIQNFTQTSPFVGEDDNHTLEGEWVCCDPFKSLKRETEPESDN